MAKMQEKIELKQCAKYKSENEVWAEIREKLQNPIRLDKLNEWIRRRPPVYAETYNKMRSRGETVEERSAEKKRGRIVRLATALKERDIAAYLVKRVTEIGGICRKVAWEGRSDAPCIPPPRTHGQGDGHRSAEGHPRRRRRPRINARHDLDMASPLTLSERRKAMDAESLKNALVRFEKYLTKAKMDGYMQFPIEEISLIGDDAGASIRIDFKSERLKSLTIESDGRAAVEILQEIEL